MTNNLFTVLSNMHRSLGRERWVRCAQFAGLISNNSVVGSLLGCVWLGHATTARRSCLMTHVGIQGQTSVDVDCVRYLLVSLQLQHGPCPDFYWLEKSKQDCEMIVTLYKTGKSCKCSFLWVWRFTGKKRIIPNQHQAHVKFKDIIVRTYWVEIRLCLLL